MTMTTSKFEKMATKRLKAMLETASEEDTVTIQAILDNREQTAAKSQESVGEYTQTQVGASTVIEAQPETELSPEEQAQLAGAEAAAEKGEKQVAGKKALSEAEIAEKLEKAKENVHHKVLVLPNGEIEWVPGYIAGVVLDKRSNNIMYRLKVGEKYMHKEISAKTLQILPEKAEVVARTGGRTSSGEKRTDEQAEALLAEAKVNKGRYCTIGDEKFLIRGVMRDKRSNAVMYSLEDKDGKKSYKVVTFEGITMLDEWNEDVKNRVEREVVSKSPAERLAAAEEKLAKAKEQVAKLEELIAALKKEVAEAPAEAPAEDSAAELM